MAARYRASSRPEYRTHANEVLIQSPMAALDKTTGRTVWTTAALGEDRASHCSPVLFRHSGRRILAGCSPAHGFGVNADDGKLLWTVPLRRPCRVNVMTPVCG
jgi:outer membrane protein assembly factor BamB